MAEKPASDIPAGFELEESYASKGEAMPAPWKNPKCLLENLPLAVVGIDSEGKIAFWSNGSQKTLQYFPLRAHGQPVEQVLKRLARRHASPGLEGLADLIQASLLEGSRASGWQFEYSVNRIPRLVQVDFSPLSTDGGATPRGGVLIFQDVTERCRLEEGTQVVGHLMALGQMAACVAHEIRNPLSAVKAAAQMLAEEQTGNPLADKCTDIIDRESRRLEKLLQDFLCYARPPLFNRIPLQVGNILERCRELLEQEARKAGILLECRAKPSLPALSADPEALLQAILNLGKNALEASPRGGRVCFKSRLVSREENGRDKIEIVVKDDGPGIPRKYQEQVFQPFFSTKSNGTGLGLAIARKIVDAHGGSLNLSSRPGRGTRAQILFPI
jgi:nitrogen-specific signal transduction histidine kinase